MNLSLLLFIAGGSGGLFFRTQEANETLNLNNNFRLWKESFNHYSFYKFYEQLKLPQNRT